MSEKSQDEDSALFYPRQNSGSLKVGLMNTKLCVLTVNLSNTTVLTSLLAAFTANFSDSNFLRYVILFYYYFFYL